MWKVESRESACESRISRVGYKGGRFVSEYEVGLLDIGHRVKVMDSSDSRKVCVRYCYFETFLKTKRLKQKGTCLI